MKRSLFTNLILAIALTLVLSCCEKDAADPEIPSHEDITNVVSTCPVYISNGIANTPLKDAIRQTFSNIVSMENAKIAFFEPNAPESDLMKVYNNGGFLMLCDVDDKTEIRIASLFQPMPSIPHSDNDLETDGEDNLMLFGFNKYGYEYWMPWPFKYTAVDTKDFPTSTDVGSEQADPEDPDDPSRTVESVQFVQDEYTSDYILRNMDELAKWADKGDFIKAEGGLTAGTASDQLDLNLLGQQHHFVYPLGLNAYIDKAYGASSQDWLYKNSEIVGDVDITPLYASSANADGVAGDYYIVRLELTAKNGDMWGPEQHDHGWCNIRIIGFYFEQLGLEAELVDSEGNELPDLRIMQDGGPEPTSNEGSSNHSESSTFGFNIGISPGYKWGGSGAGPSLGGNIAFSASWNKSTTRSLRDLQMKLDTPHNQVNYTLNTYNINNGRDWDNVGKNIALHYPEICRSDMRFSSAWVWFVPSSTNASAGVKDGSQDNLVLKLVIKPQYGVYSWWRGASWSRTQHFAPNQLVAKQDGDKKRIVNSAVYFGNIDMPVPNRNRCGIIELKNMSTDYTITGIKARQIGASKFTDIKGSITYKEAVKIPASEGKYELEYTFIDPNTNQKVGTYGIYSIQVNQGRNEEESTTKVSSTDGNKK